MSLHELAGPTRPLERARLERSVLTVAPALLGALLVREAEDGDAVVRVVEVEAYREDDPASHSFAGPRPRTAAMFGPAGHAYVYFTYGMHWCLNVVCEREGAGAAVLLRAAAIVSGYDVIRARRGARVADRDLLRGPGRLAAGLAVDAALYGVDLLDPRSPLRLASDGWVPPRGAVANGPRIGVREASATPWRWWLADAPEVSRYVRHPRAQTPSDRPARGTRGA